MTFPVSSSILSAVHLADFLAQRYHFNTKKINCQLLKAGINHSYLVSAGAEKYVFRVYSLNWRTQVEIEEELRFLNLLKAADISVSYPILDAKESYIQGFDAPEGERLGVLFSYAKGEKLQQYSAELHYTIGAMMGKMHQRSENQSLQRTSYDLRTILDEGIIKMQRFLSDDSEEMMFLKESKTKLLDILAKADTQVLRTGIVHLDIWFDNLNITPEGDVTLFDFDFCGNGYLCWDIAYYVLQLHNMERQEAEREAKLVQFLDGYQSIVPISEEEKRLLPYLGVALYFFYLGVQCERHENWSNVFLHETYLKRYINALVKPYATVLYEENASIT